MSKKKTTEQFIKEAKLVHGDKYDYSLVEYKNCDTKVKIKCNNCKKIFEQTPYCHTNAKQGCPTCSRISKNKKTTEQFIKEAKLVHGDKYDYSLVEYKDNKTKIKIVCNSCGKIFEQSPISHLHGCGCSRCVGKYKFTSEEWILLAKKKHNNDFDYSETVYDGYFKKVKIKCNKHNFVFETLPYSHLYLNGGCPKCKYEIVSQKRSLTTKEFIERCKKIHDYDYSITKYNGSHNTIKYICKKHGVVEQVAYYHLTGAR